MNVVRALFNFLALTIRRGNSCSCPSSHWRWKLAMPVGVLGYHKLLLSNIFCIEAFAQSCTSLPYLRLISTWIFCSSLERVSPISSALVSSTLTPLHLISKSKGISLHSISKIDSLLCSLSSTFNFFQSFNVKAASCSPYGPTYWEGSLYSSALGLMPHANFHRREERRR